MQFSLTRRADRTVTAFSILAALWLSMCAPEQAPAQTIDQSDISVVVVTRVVDGDTFVCAPHNTTNEEALRDTVRVRVLNLDTFEKIRGERLEKQAQRMSITPDRALLIGKMAKDAATEMLHGKVVTLHRGQRNAPNHDKYGRLLRFVTLENGDDFSEIMKQQGFNVKR